MSVNNSIGHILLVDDEAYITEMLKLNLEAEHFCIDVEDAAARVAALDLNEYHLIIADAMNQPYNGMDLLRDIKANPLTAHIPVIILSHSDGEESVIQAFDAGADDYVLKPFSLRELIARVRSVLRRHPVQPYANPARATLLSIGTLEADLINRQIRNNGELLPLTRTEYQLLVFLLRNKNQFFNRRQIFDQVWRDNTANNVNERIVDTNISRLRKKLGTAADNLVNRTGQGYGFID